MLAFLIYPLKTINMLRYRRNALRLVNEVTALLHDKACAGKT